MSKFIQAQLCTAIVLACVLVAQPEHAQAVRYTLLPGGYLIDDCPPCARPTIQEPMRGKFDLRLLMEDPLFAHYELTNIEFIAGVPAGRHYRVTGHGTYTVGGEVALVQDMFLEVLIDDGFTNRLCYLTNTTRTLNRRWPFLDVELLQTNGTFTQVYSLRVSAAPFHEIWFSTRHGFHPGLQMPYTNVVSAGDLIAHSGRVVKRNHELIGPLGFMPVVPDMGLDALDILPGGEIAFSMEESGFSETLGPLREGDVLSDRGRILYRYSELTGAFSPEPPPADQGLDALQAIGDGEILFSVERDFFSESLGRVIKRGDILSSRGVVLRTNEQLVARYNPADPNKDYGLDAIYLWPNGEIWFSTEDGFNGQHSESYTPGDLLSDQGYVVFRNLELVSAFAPLEDLADFGLDALFIVNDFAATAPAPRFTRIRSHAATGLVELQWEGNGRAFQVQGATNLLGPYAPVSDIIPDLFFTGRSSEPLRFFRVQQW